MMLADLYTKPTQSKLFRLLRNMIPNLNNEDTKNIICAEKWAIMEYYDKKNDRDKNHPSP